MKFDVTPTDQGLQVKATVSPKQAGKLMDEFAKCANGTCACRNAEYEKLDSMQVSNTEGGLILDLKAKAGQALDMGSVENCLEHTASQVGM
jgi:hypothetical protein